MLECVVETGAQPLVHTKFAADAQSSTDQLEGSTISKYCKLACRHFLREDAEAETDGIALVWSVRYMKIVCLIRKWLPFQMSWQKALTGRLHVNVGSYVWNSPSFRTYLLAV